VAAFKAQNKALNSTKDFRRVLDDKDIDSIIIATLTGENEKPQSFCVMLRPKDAAALARVTCGCAMCDGPARQRCLFPEAKRR